MKIDPNAPAYPPEHDPKTHPSGMTIRTQIAAMAMQGLLANPNLKLDSNTAERVAMYKADALIAELNQ